MATEALSLKTSYASLDAARARSLFLKAGADRKALNEVTATCFFDGSRAAAEAGALYLQQYVASEEKAVEVSHYIQSLPTAIPDRNAPPLARLASFLAIFYGSDDCQAPLNTFIYSNAAVKTSALEAVLGQFQQYGIENVSIEPALSRTKDFYDGIMKSGTEVELFFAINGLIECAKKMKDSPQTDLARFLMGLHTTPSPFSITAEQAEMSSVLEQYIVTEVARFSKNLDESTILLRRSLVKSFEFGAVSPLLADLDSNTDLQKALAAVGFDIVLFLLISSASANAFSGDVVLMREALEAFLAILQIESHSQRFSIDPVVSKYAILCCTCIGSFAAACGANDEARLTGNILRKLRSTEHVPRDQSNASVVNKCVRILEATITCQCPFAAICLGLLVKIYSNWYKPEGLHQWLGTELSQLLCGVALSKRKSVRNAGIVEATIRGDEMAARRSSSDQDVNQDDKSALIAALCSLLTLLILSHENSSVRYLAVKTLSHMKSSHAFLFFLPAVMLRLQEESNGAVAAHILSNLIISEASMRDDTTSAVSLNTLSRVAMGAAERNYYLVGIVSFGRAGEIRPGVATSMLLSETEKLRSAFESVPGPTRTAAASAILTLIKARPSRGTSFVPFISQCISVESMQISPKAAALCYEAMREMVEEEVLDSTKAVKVVMKNFPHVTDVSPASRASFLQLLGSASLGSKSKKGKILAETIIDMLREAISSEMQDEPEAALSWREIREAAASLEKFEVDEILRIAFAGEEALDDLELEKARLERIEKECQSFVQSVVKVGAQANVAVTAGERQFVSLLSKIAKHEWENRKRNKFDPEKIAKLRAASEALRRARKTRGAGPKDDDEKQSDGFGVFTRAVNALPTGVVKGLSELCSLAINVEKREKRSFESAIAMRVLYEANVVTPALPWATLVAEIMNSSESSADERASCLAILRKTQDDSFETKREKNKWFGSLSPLFDISVEKSLEEAKEMFLGMTEFFAQGFISLLSTWKDTLSSEIVSGFISSTSELNLMALSSAANGIFKVIESETNSWEEKERIATEEEFYRVCLSRCTKAMIGELLSDSMSLSVARLACMQGDYDMVRHAVNIVMTITASNEELLKRVGSGVRKLSSTQRREILVDLSSTPAKGEKRERKRTIAAHALGVGAFLPNTTAALSCAPCLCSPNERESVNRIVTNLLE